MSSKRISRPNSGLNAHKMVASVAIEMAEDLFEVYARDNAMYRKMRADGQVTEKAARRVFIDRVAPRLLEDARQTLISMLGLEDVHENLKSQIYEAILLDNDLRANRFVAENVAVTPSHLH